MGERKRRRRERHREREQTRYRSVHCYAMEQPDDMHVCMYDMCTCMCSMCMFMCITYWILHTHSIETYAYVNVPIFDFYFDWE